MNSIEAAWKQMQQEYHGLCAALTRNGCVQQEPQFVHPVWQKFKEPIRQLILGPPNQRFLDHPTLGKTMVRRGFTVCQEYELAYLQHCIAEKSRQWLARFRDADVPLPRECAAFNCSTNTLGHLYYAVRSLESFGTATPQVIFEFGGGYGNLARIFKQFVPTATLVIIDLPELIALQHLFLQTTLDGVTVVIHHEPPRLLEPSSINLVPAFYMGELSPGRPFYFHVRAVRNARLRSAVGCQQAILRSRHDLPGRPTRWRVAPGSFGAPSNPSPGGS